MREDTSRPQEIAVPASAPFSSDAPRDAGKLDCAAPAGDLLRAVEISKSYGRVQANIEVTLGVRAGEIYAVLGENGAGKSTLMRVLYGMESPDFGWIEFLGKRVDFNGPRDAIDVGIGMVHQHFTLVPTLTVLENLILGNTIAGRGILHMRAAREHVARLAQRYRIAVNLDTVVSQLSVGEQQRVEILKALVRGAKVLILDEPTAVLTPQEVIELAVTLKEQASKGLAIFLVTYKLAEVADLADRVSVMRSGRLIGTWAIGETTTEQLVTHMIGRARLNQVARAERGAGRPILYLNDVTALSERGHQALNGVSLTIHAGEVVGVAGVEGNGQGELAEVITGLRHVIKGDLVVDGVSIRDRATVDILEMGVAHVPQDRHRDALVLDFSVAENAVLIDHRQEPFRQHGLIALDRVGQFAEKLVSDFGIRCSSIDALTRTLSGGNQQKLVLGREFAREPKLLIAMQPTRGLDIGSIDYVHRRIIERRNAGVAVMLVSTELDEIMALSDRIAVLRDGRIVGVFAHDGADVQRIGALMLDRRNEGLAEMSTSQFASEVRSPFQAFKPYLRSRVGVILISFIVVGFVILAFGIDPFRVYIEMFKGAFGSENAVAETLVYTAPILLTGLAATVCFRCGIWNVGAEGQLYLGGIAAVGIGFNTIGLPGPLVLPVMALGAIAAGALWALVPALLRTRFGASEVIVTIMMNFLALILSSFLISGPWASGSTPITKPIVSAGYLPILLPGTRLHVDLFLALAAAIVLWFILNRTVLGYEICAVGLNPRAARVAGMPVERVIITSFLISGSVAGIAGFAQVAGIFHAMPDHMSPSYGFTGVAVALLANLDPAWAVASALFIGALNVGADLLQRAIGVPTALVWVIEGLILLTLLASGALRRT